MPTYIEFIGYAASLFVLLSFVMKKIGTLRTVNIIGCSFFIAYGILISSWPIIITNVAIVFVNGFYLIKYLRENAHKAEG
tara:strand:+ start:44491 stop:44730 length:240 start_codon:yes stop_codon:yes gene_type:complete